MTEEKQVSGEEVQKGKEKGESTNWKRLGIIVLIIFVGIQFFQPEKITKTADPEKDFLLVTQPPKDIEKIFRKACYDCHSYETKYPWYGYMAPTSWILNNHIKKARSEMNLSHWGKFSHRKKEDKLKEMVEEVEAGKMPLPSYTMIHWEADLSSEEVEKLVDWVKKKKKEVLSSKKEVLEKEKEGEDKEEKEDEKEDE